MNIITKSKNMLIGILLLIVLWQVIIYIGQYEEALLPAPFTVLKALQDLLLNGTLAVHLQASLFRFASGYILAAIPAIILGVILGRIEKLWVICDPVVQLLRPISPVAWSPFIVLWFGIGDMPAIAIIFIAAFFPILLSTVNGIRNVDNHYLKIAANLEFNKLTLLKKVLFPASLPSIVNGLHMAVGTAWIFLVAGEMIGAQTGLGYLIVDARNTLDLDYVLAGIVVIGVLGFLLDRFITLLEIAVKKYSGYLV